MVNVGHMPNFDPLGPPVRHWSKRTVGRGIEVGEISGNLKLRVFVMSD